MSKETPLEAAIKLWEMKDEIILFLKNASLLWDMDRDEQCLELLKKLEKLEEKKDGKQ